MRSVSLVPETLVKLVAVARDALTPEGTDAQPVQVLYGQPVTTTEDDVVAIGFTGVPGEAAVESTRTREQLTNDPDREAFEVTCLASSWRGDDDMEQVVNRVYHFINLINDEIMEDQTLGGLVGKTVIRSEMVALEQTDKGPVATVRFVIACDGWNKRRR